MVIQPVEPAAQGHTYSDGQSLSQGAGVCLHSRSFPFGVSLEEAAQGFCLEKRFLREIAPFGQGRVLGEHGVSLAHNKPVAVLQKAVLRVMAHFVEIERRDDIGA